MSGEPFTLDYEAAMLERAKRLVELAREEDFGAGDITADLSPAEGDGRFRLVARQPCVFAGEKIAPLVLAAYDERINIEWANGCRDRCVIDAAPQDLAELFGPVQAILSAERVLLNFLQRLSGIATLTRRYVDAVRDTAAAVYDTRKTTPGWRLLEKYAVRCGGGMNHRLGLHDAILIKDNHLANIPAERIAAGVFEMLNRVGSLRRQPAFIEVEVDTLEQFEKLLDVVGIDTILLDNFGIENLEAAVNMRNERNLKDRLKLEASGGIDLTTVAHIAATGVDRLSVGALTHSATAVDLALDRIE